MTTVTELLSLGSPRFADAALLAVEAAEGAEAAWKAALTQAPNAEAAVAGAQGHFAVGLRRDDGHAVLAVDRFAAQTLCYAEQGGRLLFAERADTLAGPNPQLDLQALYDYLYFHAIPSPRTIFKGVRRLTAGHCAYSDAAGVHLQRYWAPRFEEAPTSFEAARDRFRTLLREAVKAQLDGSTPACFLSGGTDSSTVAGLLAEVTGSKPVSYSIGFEAEGYDEMEYARIAARHFGTDHREHYITPADLVRLIPKVAQHHDQPFGNSSALPTYFCALKAHEDGVTRLLAGDGGDELFGGNTRYAKQRVFSHYDSVPAGLRNGLLNPLTDSGAIDKLPLLRKGASYVRQARVPMPDRLQTYNLLHRLGQAEVLTPAFLAQVNTEDPQAQQRAVWAESEGASFVNRMLAYDWRYTLAENDLPKVRGGTQLAGVQVAYPFLHQAIVDFSATLPTSFKLKGLKLRWFFKEALRGFLPDAIITKKKHGFGLPFGVWATRDAALKALARDSVHGLGERGIVQQAFTNQLVEELLPQHPGYYGEMVWILMMLEQWFRHHQPDYRLGR
ncbi:amidotransferase [beta proteobacterium AAP51]|nr:amidotransferase [beta proteobacterium AAP51]